MRLTSGDFSGGATVASGRAHCGVLAVVEIFTAWFVVFYASTVEAGADAAYAAFAVIAAGALGCWVGGVLGDRVGRPETTAGMMAVSGTCASFCVNDR